MVMTVVTQFFRLVEKEDGLGLLAETRNAVFLDDRVVEEVVAMAPDPSVLDDRKTPTENAMRAWRHLLPGDGDVERPFRVRYGWTLGELANIAKILQRCIDELRLLAELDDLLDGTRETLRRDRQKVERLLWQWRELDAVGSKTRGWIHRSNIDVDTEPELDEP